MVSLEVESWVWWSCVVLVTLSRFISRWMARGFAPQLDDYLIALAICFYTPLVVTLIEIFRTGSNLFPPGFDVDSLTETERQQRVYGSKLVLVVEQCQCVTVWLAKACVAILYLRITSLRWQNIAIKVLLAYIAGSFVLMTVFYFALWCRPFSQYWAVPTASSQCNAATHHLITNLVFNLSSDLAMLAIGLPIFLRMKLPWRKKITLVGIFSLGLFVILATILNKVYSFTQPFGVDWSYWYIRESSTSLLVANLPFVWKFWRRIAGFKSSSTDSVNRTKAATIEDHIGQEDNLAAVGAVRQQQTADNDDLELDRFLHRVGSNRGLTLAEFLRDDFEPQKAPRKGRGHSIGTIPPIEEVVTTDRTSISADGYTSKTSTPVSPTLNSSVKGSCSASSFV